MLGRSVMLQKKLQELESELADVFRLPMSISTSNHELDFNDIKQRFIFLDKLLSAEAESQPQMSDQFHEIERRINELKVAFCNWNESRTSAINNHDDTLSICSDCYHKHDDVVESAATVVEDLRGEKSSEKVEETEVTEKKILLQRRKGKHCGVFGFGVIVGVISIMVVELFSDHLIEYQAFLVPPT